MRQGDPVCDLRLTISSGIAGRREWQPVTAPLTAGPDRMFMHLRASGHCPHVPPTERGGLQGYASPGRRRIDDMPLARWLLTAPVLMHITSAA